jgi:predicted nuclease of predicted toxin-antitoxin system
LRFLVDADLPRSATSLLRGHGHDVLDVRDVGLGSSTDSEIARRARDERRCLVTGDFGFADVRNYDPASYAGIMVLSLPAAATARLILRLIEDVMQQPEILARLDGRLAIVEPGRLRLRPP